MARCYGAYLGEMRLEMLRRIIDEQLARFSMTLDVEMKSVVAPCVVFSFARFGRSQNHKATSIIAQSGTSP